MDYLHGLHVYTSTHVMHKESHHNACLYQISPLPDNGESSSSYKAKVSKQWSSLIKVHGNSLPASQSGWEDVRADRCHKPAILSYQKHFLIFQFPHSLSHFPLLLSFPMLVLGQLPQEELT